MVAAACLESWLAATPPSPVLPFKAAAGHVDSGANETALITDDAIIRGVCDVAHVKYRSDVQATEVESWPVGTVVCISSDRRVVAAFFARVAPWLRRPIVLVSLQADGPGSLSETQLSHPMVHRWYTWNKPQAHPKLAALPIGLAADRHFDPIRRFRRRTAGNVPARDRWLLLNFSPNTSERRWLLALAKRRWTGFADVCLAHVQRMSNLYLTHVSQMCNLCPNKWRTHA